MSILTSKPEFIERIHAEQIKADEIFQRIDMIFQFAVVWSLGAIIDESGYPVFQKKFDDKIK